MSEICLNNNIKLVDEIIISSKLSVMLIENDGIETNFISLNFDYGSSDVIRLLNQRKQFYPFGSAHLLEHLIANQQNNGICILNKFLSKKYIYMPYTTFYHTGFTIQNYGDIYEPIKDLFDLLTFQVNELDLEREKKTLMNEHAYLKTRNSFVK